MMEKPVQIYRRLRFLAAFALLPLAVGLACQGLSQTESSPTTSAQIRTQVSTTLTAAAADTAPGAETPTALPEEASPIPPTGTALTPVETPAGPSVLQVVFISGGDAWIWEEGSEARQLTNLDDVYFVRLSGDGRRLAFLRQLSLTQSELWAVDTGGENLRVLEDAPALSDMDPGAAGVVPYQVEWVPDSPVIAYNTQEIIDGPGLLLYNDLRLVDAENLDHSTLLAPGDGGRFAYSPDGSQIVVITPERISLVSSDAGRRQEALAYPPVLTYSEFAYYAKPVWSPDSAYLRVAIPPADALSDPNQPTSLWRIPTDGGAAQQVGSVIANFFSGSEPVFSPDLEQIAFTRKTDNPASDHFELHLAASDGTGDRIYAAGSSLFFESWTDQPGSFVYSVQNGQRRIFYLGTLRSDPVPLTTEDDNAASLRWVGEGRYLVLAGSYASQTWQLSLHQAGVPPVTIADLSGLSPVIDFNP